MTTARGQQSSWTSPSKPTCWTPASGCCVRDQSQAQHSRLGLQWATQMGLLSTADSQDTRGCSVLLRTPFLSSEPGIRNLSVTRMGRQGRGSEAGRAAPTGQHPGASLRRPGAPGRLRSAPPEGRLPVCLSSPSTKGPSFSTKVSWPQTSRAPRCQPPDLVI